MQRSGSPPAAPAVVCEDLGKRYRVYGRPRDRLLEDLSHLAPRLAPRPTAGHDLWAVRHLSLRVEPGETVGIIGRNGSGKSTLLQLIAGTLQPTEGRVQVQGRIAALLELGSGFNPEFTGLENVRLNAAIQGLDPRAYEARLRDVIAFADISPDYLSQPVKTYSTGMYMRLAFAAAIHVDPDILIVDEALAVGDMAFVAKCQVRIRELQQRGTTLLFVSHDLASVRALCDRCVYMDGGSIRECGPTPLVVDAYIRAVQEDANQALAARTADSPPAAALSAEQRPGTGDARFVNVELLDEHGAPIEIARFDDPVRIRLTVACRQRCSVSINYKIRDRQLIAVTGADFLIAGEPLLTMEPGETHVVEYTTRLPLMGGDYSLRASITVPIDLHQQAIFVDIVEVAHPFTVLPPERGRIYTQVYVPNTVTVSMAPGAPHARLLS